MLRFNNIWLKVNMGITNKSRWKNCLQTTIKLCVCTEDNIVCDGSVQRGERSHYGIIKCVAWVWSWNSRATNHYFPLEQTIQTFISKECRCAAVVTVRINITNYSNLVVVAAVHLFSYRTVGVSLSCRSWAICRASISFFRLLSTSGSNQVLTTSTACWFFLNRLQLTLL